MQQSHVFVRSHVVQPEQPEYSKRLGRLLRAARRKRDLTQKQLAEKMHLTQPIVARYESGKRAIDIIEFVLVARALGLAPAKLLRRLEKEMFPEDSGKQDASPPPHD
jgi:transcriptional regulator with XRE-family HTH domain